MSKWTKGPATHPEMPTPSGKLKKETCCFCDFSHVGDKEQQVSIPLEALRES